MKIKFTLALSLFFAQLLPAPAMPAALTAAVYDFTGTGEAASYGRKLTALVTADLTSEPQIILLERAELQKALSEQAFGISGLVSADAAARIGQITGAKVLVSGQVIMTGQPHLVIIANIIGTETGRLFAAKVEGGADQLLELSAELSKKIAQTIGGQATNLTAAAVESSASRIERIVKNLAGTNRPSVLVNIMTLPKDGKPFHSATAEGEFGEILLKAGFTVIDEKSERKPEVEVKGIVDLSEAQPRSGFFAYQAVMELKVQERRTGEIISLDRQETTGSNDAPNAANRSAQILAVDALAERILPLLAK